MRYLDDAELDAKAWQYAKAKGLRYLDALKLALTEQAAELVQRGDQVPERTDPDAVLDRRLRAYAEAHHVSYSEALDRFSGELVCFREASTPLAIDVAVAAMEGQLIEIFRTGRHISDAGETLVFLASDIVEIANGYAPHLREAPLTVGHPADNLPAYGWVDSLVASADGRLLMKAHKVQPAFSEAVRAGRFRKRSASFYPPRHPNNPTPGRWYLRHVAFLGAQQPAVAGLRDISF